jgi:hypothetical protein
MPDPDLRWRLRFANFERAFEQSTAPPAPDPVLALFEGFLGKNGIE